MRNFRIAFSFRNKLNFKKYFRSITYAAPIRLSTSDNYVVKIPFKKHNINKYSTDHDDESDDYPLVETEIFDNFEQTRYILFKNSTDQVISELNKCYSIQDIWGVCNKYLETFNDQQVTQAVLVLKDVQKRYCQENCTGANTSLQYLEILQNSIEFNKLLNLISQRLDDFDTKLLSYTFLYLQRLGINIEESLMIRIAHKLQKDLEKKFDLSICSKWLRVVFLESSVRPYYRSLNLVPKIFDSLDNCDSVEDLENLSICLNKLQNLVTPKILETFFDKVEYFLNKKKLEASDYNAILKIISFLNLPQWRNNHVECISKCMMLLKNNINKLDTPYLLLLYEVFFKIQEPGELLNEIQRNAAKFWQQFEEHKNLNTNTALKLFSSLMFFSSPLHRVQLRNQVEKLLKSNLDIRNLILMRKIFSYVKISDKDLCKRYWNIWSDILNEDVAKFLLVKSCINYMQFNIDIDNYRNPEFEQQVIDKIKNIIREGDLILPMDLGVFLTFVMYYSRDEVLLEVLLDKVKQNPAQLKYRDILMLSQSINSNTNFNTANHVNEITDLLNRSTEYLISMDDNNFETVSVLIKSAILRNNFDNVFIDTLMTKFKEFEYMSSKLIETISYIFFATNSIIPEVINKMTEYIVKNKNNVIGFNAEKILFLCYHLAYYPINADKFFQAVTDIIIRDQERLSGLAFLQSALSLSFFNKLPSFLVKQIFNVEFMDRLDSELANCYSKEKYPQRVRQTLMYLNRTVCLEYPEFNVPWFHAKFVKDVQKRYTMDYNLPASLKEQMVELVGKNIQIDVVTPYGYHIDFVVNLDSNGSVVSSDSDSVSKRIALLLVKHYAFTRFYIHLRGKYQMKIKHLEIMGYNISVLKFDDWSNLLYKSERIDYLKKLIWPGIYENVQYVTKR